MVEVGGESRDPTDWCWPVLGHNPCERSRGSVPPPTTARCSPSTMGHQILRVGLAPAGPSVAQMAVGRKVQSSGACTSATPACSTEAEPCQIGPLLCSDAVGQEKPPGATRWFGLAPLPTSALPPTVRSLVSVGCGCSQHWPECSRGDQPGADPMYLQAKLACLSRRQGPLEAFDGRVRCAPTLQESS